MPLREFHHRQNINKRKVTYLEVLLKLFFLFAKISSFSFGGGYAAFPIILDSVAKNSWMSNSDIANILALAGMSPGPVAVNAAVGVGFKVAGIPGIAAAFLGITLPCAIIVIVVALFFFKVYKHPCARTILYILRPVITGIIIYTAIIYSLNNGILFPEVFKTSGKMIEQGWYANLFQITFMEIKSVFLAFIAFVLLIKTKIHPIYMIASAGIFGILIF